MKRWTLCVTIALAALGAVPVSAQNRIVLRNPHWDAGCISRNGVAPAVTFSPDQGVFSILFTDLAADAQPRAQGRVRASRHCRVSFEAQIPPGHRAKFKGAQFSYNVSTVGVARPGSEIRLGVTAPQKSWSRAVNLPVNENQVILSPRGAAPHSGCGGTAVFAIDMRLLATARRSGNAAETQVDTIDIDSGRADQMESEPCSRTQ